MKYTISFTISLVVLMLLPKISASQDNNESTQDTLVYKQKYGLRLGVDIGKVIRSFADSDYTGFEINADYRFSKRIYLAGELGTEEKTIANEYLNVTASGTYFKAGFDYNTYTNWLDMQNMIFTGFRVGASSFSQTLNEFTVYDTNQAFFNQTYTARPGDEFNGLSAIWAELVIGLKAELFANLFMGVNMQIKGRISQDEPVGFENLFIPGFNRTYDSGGIGVGFGYTLSYLIPIFKKDKLIVVEKPKN
ncbi:DUF6048 family protein [Subsaximicrobium wynnwilliamsii]|nr:DUF6048 family protein [Subsaximicrobium wynnwilliamsii]